MHKQNCSYTEHEKIKYSWLRTAFPEWCPIFGSHVKRMGLLRTSIGGFPMFIAIPFFILFHLFGLLIFSNLILCPLLGLEKLHFRNYIIIDRQKVQGLAWYDRINCMYCGYANGLAMFFAARLSQVEEWDRDLSIEKQFILSLGLLIYLPVSILFQAQRMILYDFVISPILGFRRMSSLEASQQIVKTKNKIQFRGYIKTLFLNEKIASLKLNNLLEQIESAWCPIKHYDMRQDIVYPDHHKYFFTLPKITDLPPIPKSKSESWLLDGDDFTDENAMEKMKSILQTSGTVSPKSPYS